MDRSNLDSAAQIYTPEVFDDSDMDLLESGLRVFRAPKAILRAFAQIRNTPMQ